MLFPKKREGEEKRRAKGRLAAGAAGRAAAEAVRGRRRGHFCSRYLLGFAVRERTRRAGQAGSSRTPAAPQGPAQAAGALPSPRAFVPSPRQGLGGGSAPGQAGQGPGSSRGWAGPGARAAPALPSWPLRGTAPNAAGI